jgi:5-methylcytosine-specific restriction endonuclease McrA
MEPKKFVRASAARRVVKRATKKAKRQGVRALVMARAEGRCEHCDAAETNFSPLELDHFFGKARSESAETCWALCRQCHRNKTDNTPSAASWLMAFITHAGFSGFTDARNMAVRRLNAMELVARATSMTRGAP